MLITRLRVSGFKSFGDPVELQIEPGLTGVVGPNGCGKSNVVEALRWVMGESSARGLRGEEMDDVIFAGTTGRAGRDLAEVSLRLAGLGATGDEADVSRSIVRGGASTFRLNGREARARDVQRLFQDAAAGSRSTAIVAQGQIAALIEAKPDERRRMLEEAAGVGGLHSRRREAELKLEAAEANLARVGEAIQTQETRLGTLRQQAKQAERYRRLVDELREAESLFLLARWQALDVAARAAEARSVEGGAASHAAQAEVELLRERRGVAAADLERLHATEREATERRAVAAAELDRLREALARDSAERERQTQDLAQLESDLAGDRARLSTLDAQRLRLADETAALEAARPALEQATAPLAEALDAASRQLAACETAAEEARASTVRAETRKAALEAASAEASARWAEIHAERARLDGARPRAPADPGTNEADLVAADRAAEAAAARAQALSARLEAEQPALQAAIAERARADDVLREAETESARRDAVRGRAMAALGGCEDRIADARRALQRDIVELERLRGERRAIDLDALAKALNDGLAEQTSRDEMLRSELDLQRELRERRTAVEARLGALRSASDRLEAERAALEALLPAGDTGSLDLAVPEDLAAAVAAALGEDLEASLDAAAPAHWRELPERPGLAEAAARWDAPDAPALADLVDVPQVLRASLALVRVVDADRAEALQATLRPGERLVSRDGGCWRWDGLVRRPGASDAAARRLMLMDRRRRLDDEIDAARQPLLDVLDEASTLRMQVRDAEDYVVDLQRDLADCKQAAALAERALANARALAGRLDADLDRVTGEIARNERTLAEAESLAGQHRAELAEIEAMPPVDLGSARLDARVAARAAADLLEAHEVLRVEARAATAAADEAHGEAQTARRRHDEAEAERTAARHAFELALSSHEATAASLAAETRAVESRLAGLRDDVTSAAGELAGAAAAAATAAAALVASRADHDDLRDRLAAAQAALAAARSRETALREEVDRAESEHADLAARIARLEERRTALLERAVAGDDDGTAGTRLDVAAERLGDADARCGELASARTRTVEQLRSIEAELAACEARVADLREVDALARQDLARLQADLDQAAASVREALEREPADAVAVPGVAALLEGADPVALAERVQRIRASRERIGPVNLLAERELEEVGAEALKLQAEQAELTAAVSRLRGGIGDLNREARERLLRTYDVVAAQFETLYTRLFGGGRARLILDRAGDPLAAGVEIEASPPGKKLQHVSLLSGGEKALTALALIFAFFLAKPSPVCVLDEVDAPLDDANVGRLLDLMRETAEATGTRFLVVTHHPLTMARMDRLYGVTMIERGVSRLVSVELARALEMRATA